MLRLKSYRTTRLELPKKQSLSSRFPLNTCNSVQLKDTWKSIRIGLKHSIADFNDSLMYNFDNGESTDGWSSEEESVISIFDNDQSPSITSDFHIPVSDLKSSLKANYKCESENVSEMPLVVTRNIIRSIIQKNFEPAMKGSGSNIVNYVFNMIVQDYAGADMNTICNDVLSRDNDEIRFNRIEELILDKYVEIKLDALYDRCLSSVLHFEDIEIERPSLYSQYKDIWIFDADEYQVYDYVTYKEERIRDDHSFSYYTLDDYFVNSYANRAFLMNLEKFYYYYSKDTQRLQIIVDDRDNTNMEETGQEKFSYKPLCENRSVSISEQLRTTSLRFSAAPEVYEIDQEEPPFLIARSNE